MDKSGLTTTRICYLRTAMQHKVTYSVLRETISALVPVPKGTFRANILTILTLFIQPRAILNLLFLFGLYMDHVKITQLKKQTAPAGAVCFIIFYIRVAA